MNRNSTLKNVTVLGAGLSGLVAASELRRRGHRVRVLEARPTSGGRVRTRRFGDGGPLVELGAMRIPAAHGRTIRLIERLNLRDRLRRFRTLFSDDASYMATPHGHLRVREASPELVRQLRLPQPHRYREETVLCAAWLVASIRAVAPGPYLHSLGPDLSTRLAELLDGVDVRPFLNGDRLDLNRFLAANQDLAAGGRLRYFFDDVATELSEALFRLAGGMDQLTRKLTEQLPGCIETNTWVLGLHVQPDCVLVEARHGGKTTVMPCEQVLCTLPFSVLRRLRLNGIDGDKLGLIHGMRYWPGTKIAVHCREAFWARDGIGGGGSSVGGLVRQAYYPPMEHDPRNGAAFLASYTIGPDAELIDGLPRRERVTAVLDGLAAIHPALAEPGMVLGVASQAWGEDPTALGAASLRWSKDPATAARERELAARPSGRLFFAGEHCSAHPAWLEGAVESGEAAAEQIHTFQPLEQLTRA